MASSFARFLDHIKRRVTVGRTPLDEWSARRRDLYLTKHNTHNRQTPMPPVGFELTISAGERPQTHALDRAATGTGFPNLYQVTVHQTKTETSSDPQKQLTSLIRSGKDIWRRLGYYEVSTFMKVSQCLHASQRSDISANWNLRQHHCQNVKRRFVSSRLPQESCYGALSTPQQRYGSVKWICNEQYSTHWTQLAIVHK